MSTSLTLFLLKFNSEGEMIWRYDVATMMMTLAGTRNVNHWT